MIETIVHTEADYTYTLLRIVEGVIIFPYGMQKLFGWFEDFGGGVGIRETLSTMKSKNIPVTLGWLVILSQSIGSILLIAGCLGRLAAGANIIIFLGAVSFHISEGWTMNWTGRKKGEGIEYFVLLLSILLIVAIKGSGALSIDLWFSIEE
ncbi:DoxX family protein [Sphingobacterium thalpophilum]|uniref:DoxX family protein n=1 Tax=Sphingobacterium thalpophilum TaxID=259 RepID=A0ACD5C315_9SPHI